MPERGYPAGGEIISGDLLPAVPDGPAPGAVNTTPVVNVVGAEEGLVVGPDDVLVVTFSGYTPEWELIELRKAFLQAGLRDDQFVLIGANGTKLAKVRKERRAIDMEAD